MRVHILTILLCVACGQAEQQPVRGDIGDRGPQVALDSNPKANTAAPEIPRDAPIVVFLGDSITAGLHLPAQQAFPAVVQAECARRGHPFQLVNAGVSGDTSAGGLARTDWVLQREPEIVVIELGGNDGLRGQDLGTIEVNLRAIIEKVRAAGARVLLLGMRLPPSYGAEYTAGFEALYERIAADTKVAYVPYFMNRVGGVPEMLLEDGLHPTAVGHATLAENMVEQLIALLPPRPR
ncbi:MAG: arylesterase [Planctomycetes bacterium]|nr:arylesterase [Planctomycetota bacterium]